MMKSTSHGTSGGDSGGSGTLQKLLLIGAGVAALIFFGLWIVARSNQMTEQQRETLERAQERAARIDSLYLTVRGYGLAGDGWASRDTLQARVGPEAAPGAIVREDGRACVNVNVGGGMRTACMDEQAPHEGKLFRIHVDSWQPLDDMALEAIGAAPEECPTCIRAVVLGFYSRLWSTDAVEDQRLPCIPCGEILVCGAKPSCY